MKPTGIIVFLVVVVLAGWVRPSDPADSDAQAGVQLYNTGQYTAADAAWRRAVTDAPRNPDLYYNLGNTAHRRQRLGEAVLYYRRALWLSPGHGEATENLRFINNLLIDKALPDPPGVPALIRDKLIAWLGINAMGWLFLCAFTAACLAGWYALRVRDLPNRRMALGVLAATLVIAAGTGVFFGVASLRDTTVRDGVVLARQQDVRSGPSEGNPVLFTVHEGLVVELAAQTDGWRQVVLPNGWNGWIPADRLGVVQSFDLPSAQP